MRFIKKGVAILARKLYTAYPQWYKHNLTREKQGFQGVFCPFFMDGLGLFLSLSDRRYGVGLVCDQGAAKASPPDARKADRRSGNRFDRMPRSARKTDNGF